MIKFTNTFRAKLFCLITISLAALFSSHSYSVGNRFNNGHYGSGLKYTAVVNGVARAMSRAAPVVGSTALRGRLKGFGIGIGIGYCLGYSLGFSYPDRFWELFTKAQQVIVPAVYEGVASVLRAAKDKKFPPGADSLLVEPSGAHMNLSLVVPVAAGNQADMDYLASLIDAPVQEDSFKNNQKSVQQIINFSGVSSPGDSTLEEFYHKAGENQVNNYLIVLMDESNDTAKIQPRALSDSDVELITLNRTFLYDSFESDVTEYKDGFTHFLIKNIEYFSEKISEGQLGGCVLYIMISDNIARVAFAPFS